MSPEDRGGHAHIDTDQIVISAYGSFSVTIFDGKNTLTFAMNDPTGTIPGFYLSICTTFLLVQFGSCKYHYVSKSIRKRTGLFKLFKYWTIVIKNTEGFFFSSITDNNIFQPLTEFRKWFEKRKITGKFTVEQILFSKLISQWAFSPNKELIASGKFLRK